MSRSGFELYRSGFEFYTVARDPVLSSIDESRSVIFESQFYRDLILKGTDLYVRNEELLESTIKVNFCFSINDNKSIFEVLKNS